jgi:3-oxoacyl-[acyl-carrier-protein] synthase III
VHRSRIVGTGSYLPDRVVSNSELCERLRLDPEGVYRRTGIRTRHFASEGQASSDLAEHASQRALEAADIAGSSVDAIVVSTTSPDMTFPSTACHLQRRLGLRGSAAFDVAASCSGFLYGLSMADALIRSGRCRHCLVVAAEVKTRSLNADDAPTAVLFGDGAGAAVVTAETRLEPDRGLLGIRLCSDGSKYDLLQIPAGGSREPSGFRTVQDGRHALLMQGGPLFRVAVRRLAESVTDVLKEFGLRVDDVSQAIFHQANRRLLTAVAQRLNLPSEKVFTVIEDYGNCSSASLPIALDCAVRGGHIRMGDTVLLGAFGGGLTWGAGLVRW